MTRLLTFGVILGCAVTLGLAMELTLSVPGTEAAESTGCYEFVTDLDVLMAHVDAVFYAIPKKPAKAKEFRLVRSSAQVLSEFGNLFGHDKDYKANEKWKKHLAGMSVGLKELAAAAKKKDAAKIEGLIEKIEVSCNDCHDEVRDA